MSQRVVETVALLALLLGVGKSQGQAQSQQLQQQAAATQTAANVVDVAMPGIPVDKKESYLCTGVPVTKPGYIVSFAAKASADRVHHILVFGCSVPEQRAGYWTCMHHSNICKSPSTLIFAWARNAPPFEFPAGVGVAVGPGVSQLNYVIAQIHYSLEFSGDVLDYSGVRMLLTDQRPQYLAGIFAIGASQDEFGRQIIPPFSSGFKMNVSYNLPISTPVTAFAFRVHAHGHGRVISGYKATNRWTLIGKSSPMWPQTFYPTPEPVRLAPNDRLVVQCVFENKNATPVALGPLGTDEMCNFYVYYYSRNPATLLTDSQFFPALPNVDIRLFATYPPEASALMPKNVALEEAGKQNPYPFAVRSNAAWMKVSDPEFGQVAGLALDLDGNLVVFHRWLNVWDWTTFDSNRRYLKQSAGAIPVETLVTVSTTTGDITYKWGADLFYLPHDVYIDSEGSVWLTDVALHQVFKFEYGGSAPLITLGEAFIPGSDQNHFCQPASVVTTKSSVFVADGYCNSRIVRFNANGQFVASFPRASSQKLIPDTTLGIFNVVHSITLDPARKLLYVADRENARIQILSLANGAIIDQIRFPSLGRVYALKYSAKNDVLFAVNGPSQVGVAPRVFAIDPNTRQPLYSFGPKPGSFAQPHALAVSESGLQVFVGEIGPNNLWKFDISESLTTT